MKVLHDAEIQHLRRAQSHHGIAGEITVDLDRIGDRPHRQAEHLVHPVIVKDLVRQNRDPVRDHHLLKEAEQHQSQASRHPLKIPELLLWKLPDLPQQVCGTLDRARQNHREEGDEQGVAQEIPLSLRISPVHVHQIAQGLEGIKGDAHRKRKGKGAGYRPGSQQAKRRVQVAKQEIKVFKEGQHRQACREAQRQHSFFSLLRDPSQQQPARVGDSGGKEQQHRVLGVRAHIKDIACGQQPGAAQLSRKDKVNKRCRREKDSKLQGIKQHSFCSPPSVF